MNYFMDVFVDGDIEKYINTLDKDTLFIYSPTSIKKIGFNNKNVRKISWHSISKKLEKIDKEITKNSDIKKIVTFGGGSAIDIGKYMAYKINIEFICIPSMLSTNSYATNKVALIKDDKKITLNAKMADKIIIDNNILKRSKKENVYGLVDVLSIFTALFDWKIANEDIREEIDNYIYNIAEQLLEETLSFIEENTLEDITKNNIKIFELVGKAGYITNLYSTGRPESGSEHIMAKEIESRIDIPHGISVSTGILVMSLLQGRYSERILNAIMKLNIFSNSNKYGLTKEIITESFENLVPRNDRYTIVNRYVNDNNLKKTISKCINSKKYCIGV